MIPITLSKYISKHFLINVGIVLAVLVALILLFDSLEMLRRSQAKDVPLHIILEMVLMKAPTIIQEVIPFAFLLGGIMCFSKLTRTSELVATRSAGVSAWQFLAPAIIISFVFGLFVMAVFNPLAATMLSRFEQIEGKYLRGSTSMLSISSTGLWLRQNNTQDDGKTIVHALRLSNEERQLFDVTFYIFGPQNQFLKTIDAKKAVLKENYWDISNAIIDGPNHPVQEAENYRLDTNLSMSQIQESFAPPETLSFWELPRFIKTLKEAGFSALRHTLHWHSVLVIPFLLSSMVFFAAVFSLRQPRRGRTGLLISGGILVGFLIRFVSDLVSALGLSGSIPIMLAAWSPVMISMLLGMALMLHLEDG